MKIVCWNTAHSRRAWRARVQMADVDIALLQEESRVPPTSSVTMATSTTGFGPSTTTGPRGIPQLWPGSPARSTSASSRRGEVS